MTYGRAPGAGMESGTENWRVRRQRYVTTQWPMGADRGNWIGRRSPNQLVLTTCAIRIIGGSLIADHDEGFVPGIGGRYPTSRFDGSAAMTWYRGQSPGGWGVDEIFTRWDNNLDQWNR